MSLHVTWVVNMVRIFRTSPHVTAKVYSLKVSRGKTLNVS